MRLFAARFAKYLVGVVFAQRIQSAVSLGVHEEGVGGTFGLLQDEGDIGVGRRLRSIHRLEVGDVDAQNASSQKAESADGHLRTA